MPSPEHARPLGATSNTDYFALTPRILMAVPRQGAIDDGPAARQNVAFQHGYARDLGHVCGVIVVLSSVMSQDAASRRVYGAEMDPSLVCATALVVTNPLSRAIGSFFLGLTKPRIPVALFPSVEAAVPWIEERLGTP